MQLNRLLNLGRRSGSAGDAMKQQILWLLLLRVILYTLLLGVSFILQDDKYDVITLPPSLLVLFILAVYLTTIGSAFALIRVEEEYRRFSFIQVLIDTCFATTLVYFSGASHSIFTSVYFFPIIAGGLFIPIKGGLIGAAASTLLYGAVLGLEHLGYQPQYLEIYEFANPQSLQASINHFAVRGLTFFLAAVISALFGARLKTATEALTTTRDDFDRLSILYKQIFDSINTGIITVDGHGTITSANNATAAITGLSAADMIGSKLHLIFPAMDLTHSSPRNACDFERRDKQKFRIGYAYAALERSRHAAHNPQNLPPEEQISIITLKDISEIERLESQMRQAEKLAAIGMMSASIAHDFRNPLTAISGSAQVLAQEYSSGDEIQHDNYELTKIILRESDRLIKTIADFLKFARPENLDRDWFQLRPCLDDILQVCRADPKWPESCRTELQVEKHYRVWADEKQLFTVISHLVHNALAFCPAGNERIEIRAEDRPGPDGTEMSCISVADNGPGVDPADTRLIFEPFFTTRADGTGLGLAIVRQTMEAHDGVIVIDRSLGGGAEFSLFLPLPEKG